MEGGGKQILLCVCVLLFRMLWKKQALVVPGAWPRIPFFPKFTGDKAGPWIDSIEIGEKNTPTRRTPKKQQWRPDVCAYPCLGLPCCCNRSQLASQYYLSVSLVGEIERSENSSSQSGNRTIQVASHRAHTHNAPRLSHTRARTHTNTHLPPHNPPHRPAWDSWACKGEGRSAGCLRVAVSFAPHLLRCLKRGGGGRVASQSAAAWIDRRTPVAGRGGGGSSSSSSVYVVGRGCLGGKGWSRTAP
jgi:hypothetical protein